MLRHGRLLGGCRVLVLALEGSILLGGYGMLELSPNGSPHGSMMMMMMMMMVVVVMMMRMLS